MNRDEEYLATSSSATTTTKQASSSSSSESAESQPPSVVASIERVAENVMHEIGAMDQQHDIGNSSNQNLQASSNDGFSGSQGTSDIGLNNSSNNQVLSEHNVPNVLPEEEWDLLQGESKARRRGSNSTGRKSKASRSSSKKKKHRIKPPAVIETSSMPRKGILKKNRKMRGESRNEDLSSEEGDKIGELPIIMKREASLGSVSFVNNKSGNPSNLSSSELSDTSSSSMIVHEAVDPTPMRHMEIASYPNALAFEKAKDEKYDLNDNREGAINFLLDDPQEMTRSRRIALSLVHNKYYNPNAGKRVRRNNTSVFDSISSAEMVASQKVLPSIEKAWAYFEHVTLTRYIIHERNKNPADLTMWERYKYAYTHSHERFERAQPGEKRLPTRLYDWISTPHIQLGDFGLGFGLYFSTIRAIRNIFLIAAAMSAANIYNFASSAYDDWNTADIFYRGSAVCTQTEWVPCYDCECSGPVGARSVQDWNRTNRCYPHEFSDGSSMVFVVKNQCLSEDPQQLYVLGLVNYATLIFLVISVYFLLDYHLDKETVSFDEDEQTAQDYSILVKNPPQGATDPEEWRQYFEETFPGVKVVAVTCNVNNDLLIKSLVKRREVLRRMELQLDHGTNMGIDNLALLAAQESESRGKYLGPIKGLFFPGLPELLSKLVALNTSIKGFTQLSYPCTNVFVTLELESHQRLILSKLAVGLKYIRKNDISALEDPSYAFRDTVLLVQEAPEPNSVRWQDLNADKSSKTKELLLTTLLSFASIIVCAFIVNEVSKLGVSFLTAFSISGLNLCYPYLAKFITDFESHSNESKVQTSLYVKIATFRWVNTSIIITVITPFTHTLSPTSSTTAPALIPQIASIFLAEIVTVNVIQLTDVWGHIQRHILAPRAKTQDAMNRLFKGYDVELAERYTNMTKIMFLAFWYTSIFPTGLLFASVALTVNYYTDRFSLMRSWQRAPSVGSEIAAFSRQYFLSAACIVLAAMSSFYWAAFPFDNLCESNYPYRGVEEEVSIDTEIYPFSNNANFTVTSSTQMYRFCNQDFILGKYPPRFPFWHRDVEDHGEWMTEEQKVLSNLFGATSIAVIALVGVKYVYGLGQKVKKQFHREHEFAAEDQGISFYDVRNIAAYVPQVRSVMFSYPLIVCSTRRLSDEVLDWTDPDLDYEYYDLTRDADHVLTGGNRPGRNSFDRVRYWPPNGSMVRELKQQKRKLEEKARRRRSKNIFNTVSKPSVQSILDRSLETESDALCPTCGNPMQNFLASLDGGDDDGDSDDSDGDSMIDVSLRK